MLQLSSVIEVCIQVQKLHQKSKLLATFILEYEIRKKKKTCVFIITCINLKQKITFHCSYLKLETKQSVNMRQLHTCNGSLVFTAYQATGAG